MSYKNVSTITKDKFDKTMPIYGLVVKNKKERRVCLSFCPCCGTLEVNPLDILEQQESNQTSDININFKDDNVKRSNITVKCNNDTCPNGGFRDFVEINASVADGEVIDDIDEDVRSYYFDIPYSPQEAFIQRNDWKDYNHPEYRALIISRDIGLKVDVDVSDMDKINITGKDIDVIVNGESFDYNSKDPMDHNIYTLQEVYYKISDVKNTRTRTVQYDKRLYDADSEQIITSEDDSDHIRVVSDMAKLVRFENMRRVGFQTGGHLRALPDTHILNKPYRYMPRHAINLIFNQLSENMMQDNQTFMDILDDIHANIDSRVDLSIVSGTYVPNGDIAGSAPAPFLWLYPALATYNIDKVKTILSSYPGNSFNDIFGGYIANDALVISHMDDKITACLRSIYSKDDIIPTLKPFLSGFYDGKADSLIDKRLEEDPLSTSHIGKRMYDLGFRNWNNVEKIVDKFKFRSVTSVNQGRGDIADLHGKTWKDRKDIDSSHKKVDNFINVDVSKSMTNRGTTKDSTFNTFNRSYNKRDSLYMVSDMLFSKAMTKDRLRFIKPLIKSWGEDKVVDTLLSMDEKEWADLRYSIEAYDFIMNNDPGSLYKKDPSGKMVFFTSNGNSLFDFDTIADIKKELERAGDNINDFDDHMSRLNLGLGDNSGTPFFVNENSVVGNSNSSFFANEQSVVKNNDELSEKTSRTSNVDDELSDVLDMPFDQASDSEAKSEESISFI